MSLQPSKTQSEQRTAYNEAWATFRREMTISGTTGNASDAVRVNHPEISERIILSFVHSVHVSFERDSVFSAKRHDWIRPYSDIERRVVIKSHYQGLETALQWKRMQTLSNETH